jgi:hypothetical protein
MRVTHGTELLPRSGPDRGPVGIHRGCPGLSCTSPFVAHVVARPPWRPRQRTEQWPRPADTFALSTGGEPLHQEWVNAGRVAPRRRAGVAGLGVQGEVVGTVSGAPSDPMPRRSFCLTPSTSPILRHLHLSARVCLRVCACACVPALRRVSMVAGQRVRAGVCGPAYCRMCEYISRAVSRATEACDAPSSALRSGVPSG